MTYHQTDRSIAQLRLENRELRAQDDRRLQQLDDLRVELKRYQDRCKVLEDRLAQIRKAAK